MSLGECCGCADCDVCAVVCKGCEHDERVRGCEVTAILVWETGQVWLR